MINILYVPTLFLSTDGQEWECQHESARADYVTVNHDDSELVTICNGCDAQLIGEEWI